MTTIVENPTPENTMKARIEEYSKTIHRLEEKNRSLYYSLERYKERMFFLEKAIEIARQNWSRVGADEAMKELIKAVRTK